MAAVSKVETARISGLFAVIFLASAEKGEGFQKDGRTLAVFSAFNSNISEHCSILHNRRKDERVQNFAAEHEIGWRFHIDPGDLPALALPIGQTILIVVLREFLRDRDVPDVLGVLGDGAVGGEPAYSGDVQESRPSPFPR